MNTGHLNIQKLEMNKFPYSHDIETNHHILYFRVINVGFGKNILEKLEADPRVQALSGTMLNNGLSATSFNVRNLAMWFLWAINEYGTESAEFYLNKFLDSKTVPAINAVWVLGIEIEEPIELDNEVRIFSIDNMPDSRHKEQYLRIDFDAAPHRSSMPKAAITSSCEITKSYRNDGYPESRKDDKKN
jgi:hypothetical protein